MSISLQSYIAGFFLSLNFLTSSFFKALVFVRFSEILMLKFNVN